MKKTIRVLKSVVRKTPLVNSIARYCFSLVKKKVEFENSGSYWEERYNNRGDSGDGSYGRLAYFKAEVLNGFVQDNSIKSVIELGCGDGAQLTLMNYPSYTGLDVSETILNHCREKFEGDVNKVFFNITDFNFSLKEYDLALSLDVIYHLVEDDVFDNYMTDLFKASRQWVIIYSSNKIDDAPYEHVKHRHFMSWVEENCPDWALDCKIDQKYPFDAENGDTTSFADFYIFKRLQ